MGLPPLRPVGLASADRNYITKLSELLDLRPGRDGDRDAGRHLRHRETGRRGRRVDRDALRQLTRRDGQDGVAARGGGDGRAVVDLQHGVPAVGHRVAGAELGVGRDDDGRGGRGRGAQRPRVVGDGLGHVVSGCKRVY